MLLRFHRLAIGELDEILTHAKTRNPQEARNIERAVERTLNTVLAFPQSGTFMQGRGWYEKYVPRTRIKLIYRFTNDELLIGAVFHTSRDPEEKPFDRQIDEL